jgi:hypothetical protein
VCESGTGVGVVGVGVVGVGVVGVGVVGVGVVGVGVVGVAHGVAHGVDECRRWTAAGPSSRRASHPASAPPSVTGPA